VERLLDAVQPHFAQWGYLIVFGATFLENAAFVGAVIPGDIVLLIAGVYALRGALELPQVMMLAFAGGVLGDIVGYAAGRYAGRFVAERFGRWLFLPRDRLARVERYFERNGRWAVFLGRFAPVVRALRTFVAGITKMPFLQFVAADVPGAGIWAVAVPLIGYLFAESLTAARRSLGGIGLLILAVLIVLFVLTYRAMVRRLAADETDGSR
jgi:undecaprenyl-diphosphatase